MNKQTDKKEWKAEKDNKEREIQQQKKLRNKHHKKKKTKQK